MVRLGLGPTHRYEEAGSTMATSLFPMLSCVDVERSLLFYGTLLGGVETYRYPEEGEPGFLTLGFGDSSQLGLGAIAAEPAHGIAQRPASGHRIELCVSVDDTDETCAAARELGFEVVTEPADMPWGERTAWVADPDGNLVMLTQEPTVA
jgi:lactoylglutathione lyase